MPTPADRSDTFIRLDIDPSRVTAVNCSRWATILEMEDGAEMNV